MKVAYNNLFIITGYMQLGRAIMIAVIVESRSVLQLYGVLSSFTANTTFYKRIRRPIKFWFWKC